MLQNTQIDNGYQNLTNVIEQSENIADNDVILSDNKGYAFTILSGLNIDLAVTIRDCESVSTDLLIEYQRIVNKALSLLS